MTLRFVGMVLALALPACVTDSRASTPASADCGAEANARRPELDRLLKEWESPSAGAPKDRTEGGGIAPLDEINRYKWCSGYNDLTARYGDLRMRWDRAAKATLVADAPPTAATFADAIRGGVSIAGISHNDLVSKFLRKTGAHPAAKVSIEVASDGYIETYERDYPERSSFSAPANSPAFKSYVAISAAKQRNCFFVALENAKREEDVNLKRWRFGLRAEHRAAQDAFVTVDNVAVEKSGAWSNWGLVCTLEKLDLSSGVEIAIQILSTREPARIVKFP